MHDTPDRGSEEQRLRAESISNPNNEFDGTLVSEHGDVHDFVRGKELATPPGFTNHKDDEFDLESEIDGALAEGSSSRRDSIDGHDAAPAAHTAASAVTPPSSNGVAPPAAPAADVADDAAGDAQWKNVAQQLPGAIAQANNQMMQQMPEDQRARYQQYLAGDPPAQQKGFLGRMADRLSSAWESVKSAVSRLRGGSDAQTPAAAQAPAPGGVAPPQQGVEGSSRGVEGPSHSAGAPTLTVSAPAQAHAAQPEPARPQAHEANDGTYFDVDDDHDASHDAGSSSGSHAAPGTSGHDAGDAPHHVTNDEDRAKAHAIAHELTIEHQAHEAHDEHTHGKGKEIDLEI